MPQRSKPSAARLPLDRRRRQTSGAAGIEASPTASGLCTSCRSTYGRMPPCRNATSSSGVSIRAIACELAASCRPSPVARTVTSPPGRRLCADAERRRSVSRPVSFERRRGLAGAGTAAAARPCSRGCCGGCARSSRRCTALTPSSSVPFAAQSRDEPEPYSLPAMISSGTPASLVLHRRVVDRHHLAAGQVASSSRLRCRARAGCAGGCWRTCRASSLRDCRGARRTS